MSGCSRRVSERRGSRTVSRLRASACARSGPRPTWWLESARRLDEAGFAGVWCWDHFIGKGDKTVPVVEAWTILAMAAAQTTRITVGTFVMNVMNRHPAVVARMASTLHIASGGRLVLGIGIGGAPREHEAYGIDFPDGARTGRAARGGGRRHPRAVDRRPGHAAVAVLPAARRVCASRCRSRRRRIILGGETRTGARAGRADRRRLDRLRRQLRGQPAHLPRSPRGGWPAARRPDGDRRVPGRLGQGRERRPSTRHGSGSRASTWERWREAGADGAILTARSTEDVDALVESVARW